MFTENSAPEIPEKPCLQLALTSVTLLHHYVTLCITQTLRVAWHSHGERCELACPKEIQCFSP